MNGKLLVQPREQMRPMDTLHLSGGLADGHMTGSLLLQSSPFLFEKAVGHHHQNPETTNRFGIHQLVVVEAQ